MHFKTVSRLFLLVTAISLSLSMTAEAVTIGNTTAFTAGAAALDGVSFTSPFDAQPEEQPSVGEAGQTSDGQPSIGVTGQISEQPAVGSAGQTGEEQPDETSAAAPVMTAGAGSLVDTVVVPAEDADVQDDSDEDASGMAYGYTNLGVANVEDHLNIRESTDDSSKIVGKMSANAGCEVLEIVGGKAHITSGSVEGYVSMDYLLTGKAALNRAESIVKNLATVTADGLKVRSEASTESEVVGMVAYGEELEVLQEQDGWVKVSYDEESAYVSADYVTVGKKLKTALNMTEFLYGEGVSDVRVELCEYAKQFIGNPYVWGGVSLTKGADCSGFVLSVYQKFGISLPHSSRAQANMGRAISMSEAKPGDLVFYSKGGRINHVAIYIGGGQVCHASSPKTGIKVSGAYYRSPAKVVRILQD